MALQFPPTTCSASASALESAPASPTPMWAWSTNCGGYGSLVAANVTTLAGGATAEVLLCKCDPGYSPGMDMFDARVANTNGERLGLDCSLSVVGQTVMWSLCAALVFWRCYSVAVVLAHRCRSRGIPPTEPGSGPALAVLRTLRFLVYEDLAYRCLLSELVLITPFFLSTSLLKAVAQDVIGTDVAVTVCFALTPLVYQYIQTNISLAEFAALVSTLSPTARARLTRAHRAVVVSGMVVYLLFTTVPTLAALGVTRAPNANVVGPVCSNEYVLLLLRNVGVVSWQALSALSMMWLKRLVAANITEFGSREDSRPKVEPGAAGGGESPTQTPRSIRQVPSMGGTTDVVAAAGGAAPDDAYESVSRKREAANLANATASAVVQRVMERLDVELRSLVGMAVAIVAVYAVFMVPILWTQQTYLISVAWLLSLRHHAGRHFAVADLSKASDSGSRDKASPGPTGTAQGTTASRWRSGRPGAGAAGKQRVVDSNHETGAASQVRGTVGSSFFGAGADGSTAGGGEPLGSAASPSHMQS